MAQPAENTTTQQAVPPAPSPGDTGLQGDNNADGTLKVNALKTAVEQAVKAPPFDPAFVSPADMLEMFFQDNIHKGSLPFIDKKIVPDIIAGSLKRDQRAFELNKDLKGTADGNAALKFAKLMRANENFVSEILVKAEEKYAAQVNKQDGGVVVNKDAIALGILQDLEQVHKSSQTLENGIKIHGSLLEIATGNGSTHAHPNGAAYDGSFRQLMAYYNVGKEKLKIRNGSGNDYQLIHAFPQATDSKEYNPVNERVSLCDLPTIEKNIAAVQNHLSYDIKVLERRMKNPDNFNYSDKIRPELVKAVFEAILQDTKDHKLNNDSGEANKALSSIVSKLPPEITKEIMAIYDNTGNKLHETPILDKSVPGAIERFTNAVMDKALPGKLRAKFEHEVDLEMSTLAPKTPLVPAKTFPRMPISSRNNASKS